MRTIAGVNQPAGVTAVANSTRGTLLGVRVQIARTMRDRTVGLLRTSSLEAGEGLWIERAPSIHMFFMKYPIDAVFVDEGRRVVKVVENLRPWRVVWWARGARDCLELPVGGVKASRTEVGDQLELVDQESAGDDHTSRATAKP